MQRMPEFAGYAAIGNNATQSATSPAAIAAAMSICRMTVRPRWGERADAMTVYSAAGSSLRSGIEDRCIGSIAATSSAGVATTHRQAAS
ncbi:MAG TPA: hypothetical protein VME47_16925 [Acetobacteraceae bacterium]|nr:hypothetical protein [Acetobacteraceae bacterium]